MEAQIERAVEVAWDSQSTQDLKAQAFDYLNQIRSQQEGWSTCFGLAIRQPPPAEVVRHVAIDILNNAIRTKQLSEPDLMAVSSTLLDYVVRVYGAGASPNNTKDPVSIQNKITQTITYLFAAMYERSWPSFFHDIAKLMNSPGSAEKDNAAGTIMYLRILISIHDEIADVMVSKSADEQKYDTVLKDLVRQRDIAGIAVSWHEILARWRGQQDALIELCLNCIGRWVAWTDISLAVNESLLSLLFDLLKPHYSGDQGPQTQENRQAAIETFIDILGKKMSAYDKLELITVLRLEDAVQQLVNGRSLLQQRHTPEYDTDLAEDVAKLVNNTVFDIVRAIEMSQGDVSVLERGTIQLKAFLPHLLRFLSDEYDEICSTVIPSLTDLLALMRKQLKVNGAFLRETSYMLPMILDAVITKVRYDETADWGNEDAQTDEAEFQELRKRLHVLQQAVAAVDEQLYTRKITDLVLGSLEAVRGSQGRGDWRDTELALHQMYLFGDLAMKHGGLYSKTKPVTPAAEQLISMLFKLMEIDLNSISSPAIHLQYMEICVRYYMFFEANPIFISQILEFFVIFVHHTHPKVRLRSWYLLQRFVKHVRPHIGNIAETVIRALGDLLLIKAEVPDDDSEHAEDDGSSSTDGQSANARFTSQLYLYETVGCVISVKAVPLEVQIALLGSVLNPLFVDMDKHLTLATSGNKQSLLQTHHLIMALGTVARGFSDWSPAQNSASSSPIPEGVAREFARASEAILLALNRLKTSFEVREAGRFAFSRFVGVLDSRILDQLPRWIEGLLTVDSTKDEIALFMRLLDQVVFGFKSEIQSVLDTLLTPLLQRVIQGIGETAAGTDDEIQLAELKREYLAFLTVILNNNLESVLVSETNQASFGLVISTMELLARDINDLPTAKLTLSVLSRMVSTWGGPDIVQQTNLSRGVNVPNGNTKVKLAGFDQFMMTRFSPLCWSIPGNSGFDSKDAQSKQLLAEAASLQKTIYSKSGQDYLVYLRDVELSGMGMGPEAIQAYLNALSEMDVKGFQNYFKDLIQRTSK